MRRRTLIKLVALAALPAAASPATASGATATTARLRARLIDSSGQRVLRTGRLRVRVFAPAGTRVGASVQIPPSTRRGKTLTLGREKVVKVSRRRTAALSLRLNAAGRRALRAAVAA